jgi:hypothetical protein
MVSGDQIITVTGHGQWRSDHHRHWPWSVAIRQSSSLAIVIGDTIITVTGQSQW